MGIIEEFRESIRQVVHNESYRTEDEYWTLWVKKYKNQVERQKLFESARTITKELLHDESHLQRILTARKDNLKLSTELFLEQVKWRARWQPQKIDPNTIANALKSGAWRLCGYSEEGCVVSNYKLSLWKPNDYGSNHSENGVEEAVKEYVRYIAYMMELMIGKMPSRPVPQQFVVLFDLQGFTTDLVFNKKAREMIQRLIYVAQSQYPERLRKVYLINSPWGFSTAWKLIKSIMDPKTASKVSFVTGDLVQAMRTQIHKDTLSIAYGGTHDEYHIPSLSLREEIAVETR